MFIGGDFHALYAALHRPPMAAKTGMLLVPPLLHEQPRSRRFVTELANCLATAGVPTLRFDFYGSGDSGGRGEAMDFVSMQRDLETAAEALRNLTGVSRLGVLAFRAASLPTSGWLASGGQADAVFLWDPIIDGAQWLELLQRQDLAERTSLERYPLGRWPDIPLEDNQLMGFTVGNRLRDQIRAARVNVDELARDQACVEVFRSDAAGAPGAVDQGDSKFRIALPTGTPAFGDTTRMNDALFMSVEIRALVKNIAADLIDPGAAPAHGREA